MIEIEIPKRKNNIVFMSDDNKRYYLVIHTKQHKPEWSGRTPAYMFDGNHSTKDEFPPAVFRLYEYIKVNSAFTVTTGGTPMDKRKGEKDISLTRVLHSFYTDMSIGDTDNNHVKLINSNEVVLNNLTDTEEIEFFKAHYVHDFTAGNIVSDIRGAETHSNGHIFIEYPSMGVEWNGKRFHTSYDQGLCNFLPTIPNWNIQGGALKASIWNDESKKSIFVPFSNIVIAYHRGIVPNNTDNVREKLETIYQGITGKRLLIDHLTERTENNYPFLLALTNRSVNGATNNFRTRIKAPYFFFSVYDHARNKCLVWLGIEGTGWEKRIVFGDLTDKEEYTQYLHCLNTFKEIARSAECLMDTPGEDSLLYYWANPDRMNDKENPLTKLLSEPMSRFTIYHDGIFFGRPEIKN